MMNKKGGTIFKLILIILLTTIFSIFVIYVMRAIKDKNKITTTKDNIKMVEPTIYNPINDIFTAYYFSYQINNFAANSTYAKYVLNYENNSNIYYLNASDNTYRSNTSTTGTPRPIGINKSENKLYVGQDIYNQHKFIRANISSSGSQSHSICYNSEIDIQGFNFTLFYNLPIDTFSIYFYVYTDVDSARFTFNFNSNTTSVNFTSSQLLAAIPNATKILRFGFATLQKANATNQTYYLPQYTSNNSSTTGFNYLTSAAYENYFENLNEAQQKNSIYIAFNTENYPESYISGYNTGYQDAINESNLTINELNSNIVNLTQRINELTSLTASQQITINNLQTQINESETNFKGLFFTIADIPFKTVANALGFEALGMNLFNFFVGVITALGMIWLIRKIWL